jgi:hypothetical protein
MRVSRIDASRPFCLDRDLRDASMGWTWCVAQRQRSHRS